MATIQKRKNKNGTYSYKVMIRKSDGFPNAYKTWPTRQEAIDWATDEEGRRRQGAYFPEQSSHKCTVKDYEPPPEIHFKPKLVLLDGWVDQEDGEIMTSCVLKKVEGCVSDKLGLPKLQRAQKIAYDCLSKLLESQPEGIHIDVWRKMAYEANISSTGSSSDAKKKAFQRALNELEKKGYVQSKNDLWILNGTRDRDGTFGGHVPVE